jgi:hypothetical protein
LLLLALKMGVPQGSILGPLLFTFYIRNLGEIIHSSGVRYAVYADVTSPKFMEGIKKIENAMLAIENWTGINYLQLNSEKTEFILLGTKEQIAKISRSEVTLNGITFNLRQVVRNLGVLIDSFLKFEHHVDNICRMAYCHLRTLHRLRMVARGSSSTMGKRSFLVAAPELWRQIPWNIRAINDRFVFQTSIKRWLLTNVTK